VSLVYSTNKHNQCTTSHPAVGSPSHPQMAVVSVSGKVSFFHDDGPKGCLLNLLSSVYPPLSTELGFLVHFVRVWFESVWFGATHFSYHTRRRHYLHILRTETYYKSDLLFILCSFRVQRDGNV